MKIILEREDLIALYSVGGLRTVKSMTAKVEDKTSELISIEIEFDPALQMPTGKERPSGPMFG